MSADVREHVDYDTLETVEAPGELGWTFDSRRFMAMLGAAGGSVALGTVATRAAEASSALFSGVTVDPKVTDPVEYSVAELALLYERRKLSPVEVVQAYIDRIERYDADYYKAYNAFVPDLALARAGELEKVPKRSRTALWGIPYAPKDNFFTKGIPTTANSDLYATFVPDFDATYVARLGDAGAVLLGKTQMGPLAAGRPTTPNGIVTTRNAWSPDDSTLSPSGSSGGSGCAPKAKLAAFCLGTQTGGSILGPTGANGLTGLKPTLGRTSVHGVIPLSITRDHTGPMGRNVKDIAISLVSSDGPDPADPRTVGVPRGGDYVEAATPVKRSGGRVGLRWRTRIGVPPGWADGDTPTALARRNALDVLADVGATLVDLPTPPDVTRYAGLNATTGEGSDAFRDALHGDLKLFNGRLTGFVSGLMRGADHYILGRRAQYLLSQAILEQMFDKVEAVLSPPSFDPAGFPLIGFPIGYQPPNDIGVTAPIGVQLGGRPYDERRLFSIVAAFQAVTDFHLAQPPEPAAAADGAAMVAASASRRQSAIRITPEELYEIELAGEEA